MTPFAAALLVALAAPPPPHAAAFAGPGPEPIPAERVFSGRGERALEVPLARLEAPDVVDGVLDEPAWGQASLLTGFSQFNPVDGVAAADSTEVLVWYSPTAIHFGIRAFDRSPGSVRATVADRDNIGNDDRVTIYLDTFRDQRRAFFFAVNPLGIQDDGVRSEGSGGGAGNLFGGNVDRNPDFIWQSRGRRTETGYEVEVRIPFKSLRFPGSGPQSWGINISRVTQRTGYEDTWTDVRRANASFLAQAGTLEGLHDLRSGTTVELQPFTTAFATGERAADGAFERNAIDPDAGLNLKVSRTNLALDATLNPDFSQVESDVGLVQINERFALFFPERRPFFLEGIELFATPNQLVYTRQVADPLAGGKVTGKFGRWGIAHLTALDETPDGDALFNVTRVRRDLGRTSLAGLTLTDRTRGGEFNRVAAADARLVLAKLYFIEGQVGRSWTRDALGRRDGAIWKLEADRTGRMWGFNYGLNGIEEDFQTRAGFVNRTGIVRGNAFNRLSFYGARGDLVEQVTTFAQLNRLWLYDDFVGGGAFEGSEALTLNVRVRGGWQVNGRVQREFVGFLPGDYAGFTVGDGGPAFQPAAEASGLVNGYVEVQTPSWQALGASLRMEYGARPIFPEAAEGRETRLITSATVRATRSLRVIARATVASLDRRDGSEFARTILPRLQAEFQPNRALFFRFIGEYRSERQAARRDPATGLPLYANGAPLGARRTESLRVDWLASFEPTPGTVAFLGYGASLTAPEPYRLRDLERTNDGFFVKLAYLFRR
ncbi:MAG: DUF5916 domain-containing protein [Gemmatimonadales bacterium]|nr:DUF5916 domain-containing protein [Gemmatimonadales bacterium]